MTSARNVPREDQHHQRHDERNYQKQRVSATLRAGSGHAQELSLRCFCYSSSKRSSSRISDDPAGNAFSSSISHVKSLSGLVSRSTEASGGSSFARCAPPKERSRFAAGMSRPSIDPNIVL